MNAGKKNMRWILLATAIFVIVALACSSSDETPTAEMTPTPPPTSTAVPTPEPEGAALEITNESGTDVWYVFLSPSDTDEWGEDWLGDDVIPDGETYIVAGIPEGTYDVKAEDENNEVIEAVWSAEVEGKMAWTITGLASLEIINQSDDTIAYLYISPSESTTWGDDWLGGDVIDPGDTYVVEDVPRGTYDIQAADPDEDTVEVLYNVIAYGRNNWEVEGKATVPSSAVIRFEDDFTDNRNNWGSDVEGEDVFYMRPADGEYCILIKSDSFTAWEWYEPFRTEEFVAEVACSVEGAGNASCGLGFGSDEDNLYWFEVSPSNQGYALFLREGGTWQDNLVDWTVSKHIDPNGGNYLSMQRVGGVLSLYINGALQEQVDGGRFPTGRLGIGGSTYEEGSATVCLDNLRVWRLE